MNGVPKVQFRVPKEKSSLAQLRGQLESTDWDQDMTKRSFQALSKSRLGRAVLCCAVKEAGVRVGGAGESHLQGTIEL